ncbi:MAG TPA: serine protease [Rubrivivax sp.]|nr:serine protease [Burkholderiales bacterium]HNU10181.1 serine protease [Rubrivivax sp.]
MPIRRRSILLAGGALSAQAALSAGLVDLIASLKPSVCAVGSYDPLASPRFRFRGSGCFVADGSLVATCWHVLPETAPEADKPDGAGLAVLVPSPQGGGEVRPAELLRGERQHDLALLRVGGRPGVPVTLAADNAPREGMEVALMGFPVGGILGFRPVTHRGIIAAIVASALPTPQARQLTESAVARLRDGSFELLQLDATAYPGNSGGPLFDVQTSQMLGTVNMVLVKGNRESALSQPTGITYAVPVRYLHELLARR